MEMELLVLTARSAENQKALDSAYEKYRRQLFPGIEKDKDEAMERAKRALVEETKKVYIVRRLDSVGDLRKSVEKAAASGAPGLAKAAALELQKREAAEARVRERLARSKPKS